MEKQTPLSEKEFGIDSSKDEDIEWLYKSKDVKQAVNECLKEYYTNKNITIEELFKKHFGELVE